MARRFLCFLLLTALAVPAANAATFKGSLNPTTIKTVGVASLFDTQLLVTVYVKKPATWPLVVIGCNGVTLATSVGVFTNFARVEASIPGETACAIGLTSIQGASAYTVNVEITSSRSGELPLHPSSGIEMAPMSSSDFPWLEESMENARRIFEH